MTTNQPEHNDMKGSIFIYEGKNKKLIPLDDSYIQGIRVTSVRKVLGIIRNKIIDHETKQLDPCGQIFTAEDVTFCFVEIGRWRRGSGFVCLQISIKNKGMARAIVFTTNVIHHSATCFGTTPDVQEASELLNQYLADQDRVIKDLTKLKQSHPTSVSAEKLLACMQTL
jgi:hypothetical protein